MLGQLFSMQDELNKDISARQARGESAEDDKFILSLLSRPYGSPRLKMEEDAARARNKELAMHHALIIQRQKDMEAAILKSIEELIEFPLHTRDLRLPDPSDVKQLKAHLSLFKTSDLWDAVIERNVEDKCGYFLCSKQRRKQPEGCEYRVVRGRIRAKEDIEKWCSDECSERTYYLFIQLRDTSVGERASKRYGGLKLYGEVEGLEEDQERPIAELVWTLDQLAMERGEQANSFRSKTVMGSIRDKDLDNLETPRFPTQNMDDDENDKIEGFAPAAAGTWTTTLPTRPNKVNDSGDILDSI